MKQNLEKTYRTFSKRAEAILSTPSHLSLKSPGESAGKKWIWNFTLEKIHQNDFQSDKILTLFYFNKSEDLLDSLFLEAISRMAIGKSIVFLQQLSFRELENFLRDENHLPVFDNLDTISATESFKKVKTSLLGDLLLKEIEKKGHTSSHLKGWNELTLVEKNQKAREFLEGINNLFSRAKPLQLALAGDEELALVMNDFPIDVSVIEELARVSFGTKEEISFLKVVAVQ